VLRASVLHKCTHLLRRDYCFYQKYVPLCWLLTPSLFRTHSLQTAVAFALWTTVVVGGFRSLIQYEVTSGAAGELPAEWPAAAPVVFDGTKSNLVMLAHPRCPCTRASLAELVKVMTQSGDAIKATVLFAIPRGDSAWEQGKLWQTAKNIPGVQVSVDRDGVWAKRFGAETSGHVVLFDRHGRVVFRGGITGARGHEGDNPGEQAVINLAFARTGFPGSTPVFGCALSTPIPQLDQNR